MNDLRHSAEMKGFTLLEMIITLVIAAILLTLAVPSFQSQIRNSRISTASQDLVATLMFAKSETVGRSEFVSICQRDPNSPGCATTAVGWEQGWLVFVDSDQNGVIADPNDPGEVLYRHRALAQGITARATGLAAGPSITFRPNGLTSMTATDRIVFCDERGWDANGTHARGIVVSIMGKASSMTGPDTGAADCLVGP